MSSNDIVAKKSTFLLLLALFLTNILSSVHASPHRDLAENDLGD
jgi:hypothetical protein